MASNNEEGGQSESPQKDNDLDENDIPRCAGLRAGLRKRKQITSLQEIQQVKIRKSAAQACKEYRDRQKEYPFYNEIKKYNNLRIKTYKLNMSAEKKEQYREKTRLRVQKYRRKKHAEGKVTKEKVLTRKEKEKKLQSWREQKRKQHAGETRIQRDARNARRRELYAQKKTKSHSNDSHTHSHPDPLLTALTVNNKPPFQTDSALKKAAYRSKQHLPRDPEKRTAVLAELCSQQTPTKRKILKNKILSPNSKKKLHFIENIREELNSLKSRRNEKALKKKRILAELLIKKYTITVRQSKEIGICYKMLRRSKTSDIDYRKKRKDVTPQNIKCVVEKFYERTDIARSLPDARASTKGQISSVGRMVMERSIDSAYSLFVSENPDIKLSRSVFASLRPRNVMPSTSSRKRDCLCEYCANMDLKLEALRLFATKKKIEGITIKDRFELSRLTLCLKGANGEYKRTCLERTCNNCGTNAIKNCLGPLLENCTEDTLQFSKWETVVVDGKSRMTRITKTSPVPEFVNALCEELQSFSKHLFDASWQGRQYNLCESNMDEGCLLVCEDFAENFKMHFQDEAQGAHWSYNQATLHASVASYKCPEQECQQTTREAIIFISDCNKHDTNAVYTYDKLLIEHFKKREVRRIIFFSDGAPSQYKNKSSFADLSFFKHEFGIENAE